MRWWCTVLWALLALSRHVCGTCRLTIDHMHWPHTPTPNGLVVPNCHAIDDCQRPCRAAWHNLIDVHPLQCGVVEVPHCHVFAETSSFNHAVSIVLCNKQNEFRHHAITTVQQTPQELFDKAQGRLYCGVYRTRPSTHQYQQNRRVSGTHLLCQGWDETNDEATTPKTQPTQKTPRRARRNQNARW